MTVAPAADLLSDAVPSVWPSFVLNVEELRLSPMRMMREPSVLFLTAQLPMNWMFESWSATSPEMLLTVSEL